MSRSEAYGIAASFAASLSLLLMKEFTLMGIWMAAMALYWCGVAVFGREGGK